MLSVKPASCYRRWMHCCTAGVTWYLKCLGLEPNSPRQSHVHDVSCNLQPFLIERFPPQHQVVPVGCIIFDLSSTSCEGWALPVGRGHGYVTWLTWETLTADHFPVHSHHPLCQEGEYSEKIFKTFKIMRKKNPNMYNFIIQVLKRSRARRWRHIAALRRVWLTRHFKRHQFSEVIVSRFMGRSINGTISFININETHIYSPSIWSTNLRPPDDGTSAFLLLWWNWRAAFLKNFMQKLDTDRRPDVTSLRLRLVQNYIKLHYMNHLLVTCCCISNMKKVNHVTWGVTNNWKLVEMSSYMLNSEVSSLVITCEK